MEKRDIERINQLTQISRERELTAEEREERKKLRENYLNAFRSQFRTQLDHTVVEYPDGSRASLKDAARRKK